jgi:Fe-S protein assembly chaperone HscA
MSRIVGIDLGTTHSLVAVTREGAPSVLADSGGDALLPSVVAYDARGQVCAVGREAMRLAEEDPSRVVASVKRLMGRSGKDLAKERASLPYEIAEDERVVRIRAGAAEVTPPQVSAEVLRVLKKRAESALGEDITRAVVTVPAYFDDAQRQATLDAGRIAGLTVERLVNEPTAASLAYGLQALQNGVVAVYDLGGGTFDVSILKLRDGLFEVMATAGDTHLGGDDIDRALAEHLTRKAALQGVDVGEAAATRARLKTIAERAKVALSDAPATNVEVTLPGAPRFSIALTREELEVIARPFVDRTGGPCRRALADAHLRPEDIDRVVLVGGSTRMPLVRRYVASLFEQEPLCSLNPDEVVALGAAVQADILAGDRTDLLLLDVCPLSLGIETMGGAVAKLIQRNSTIPASAREVFTTYAENQTAVDLHVVQGERELAQDCRSLARFKLGGIPPMPAGYPRLEVTFVVNTDGILEVHARETRSGAEARVQVKPSYGLSDEEVERMLIESIDHAEEDVLARLRVEARVEAEQVIAATEKALFADPDLLLAGERERIDEALRVLRARLADGDHNQIRELVESLDQCAQPFAQRRMDRAISTALRQKSVDSIRV